jgi:guanylate kinase
MSKLIVLSGPSCVGKGPLLAALRREHPEIDFAQPVRLMSRKPRLKRATGQYEVHGVDCYFLPRSLFAMLDPQYFIVGENRSEMQAIDLEQVRGLLKERGLVIMELFHTLAVRLIEWGHSRENLTMRSVFLLPLGEEEIVERMQLDSKTWDQVIYEEMKAKLLRRREDPPEKIEERARSASIEMSSAPMFDYQIINHAGEDAQEEWQTPLGPEASRVLQEFLAIVQA